MTTDASTMIATAAAVITLAGAFVTWAVRFVVRSAKALDLIDGEDGLVERVRRLELRNVQDEAYERGRRDADANRSGAHRQP
jgi:hypothetical protein